jgi:hypothetical protein
VLTTYLHFSYCKKFEIMAFSNIFFTKGRPNWRFLPTKR